MRKRLFILYFTVTSLDGTGCIFIVDNVGGAGGESALEEKKKNKSESGPSFVGFLSLRVMVQVDYHLDFHIRLIVALSLVPYTRQYEN